MLVVVGILGAQSLHRVQLTSQAVDPSGELGATPLIGFAGAPFTVASYLVEGGPSKEHAKTKAMMRGAPEVWDALMRKIAGDDKDGNSWDVADMIFNMIDCKQRRVGRS